MKKIFYLVLILFITQSSAQNFTDFVDPNYLPTPYLTNGDLSNENHNNLSFSYI